MMTSGLHQGSETADPDAPFTAPPQAFRRAMRVLRRQGRAEEALRQYEEAAAVYRRTLGPDHPEIALLLHDLALLFDEVGRPEDAARRWAEAALVAQRAAAPADAPPYSIAQETM
jgi:tetratricopeptide (TPR) repeat protein